jgi:hypothetical protein
MIDFIQGERFIQLAKYTFSPLLRRCDDYDGLQNTLILSDLKQGDIIYTHTMYVSELFKLLENLPKLDLIIISHNADENVKGYKIPLAVKMWYTTNVNCCDDRIKSIPIGIENNRWHKKCDKKQIMQNKFSHFKSIKNLVYVNHNVCTNLCERIVPYELFKDKEWATIEHGKNGKDFNNYISQIYHHKFVVCPNGNGIDTHRLWETLYMGSIPIVRRNINTSFYVDLPICFVNDWCEVTQEFLNKEYEKINNGIYCKNKLTFEWWANKIKNND